MACFASLSNLIKYWYLPCVLFCFYCLYTLIADSYEVVYLKRNGSDPVEFLACVEQSVLFPNQTEIDLKELRAGMTNYFNSSEDYRNYSEWEREGFELIMNRTKSSDFLAFNRRVCLITNDQKELVDSFGFLRVYNVVLFAIRRDTLDFVHIDIPEFQINQLIVLGNEIGNSDCDQSNSRFRCLNDCFRRSFRLSRYFYESNETEIVQLNYDESNKTIQESERSCFSECKRENCKLVQLILINNYKGLKEPKTEIFEAQLILSAFDFWLQITGLIFSFVGLCFDKFASIITKLTKKLTRSMVRRRKVKISLFCLNLAILLLSLAYCGYLCIRVALDHETEVNDLPEREVTRNLIQPKVVHLAVCVDIKKVKMFENKTMSQIESETDGALDDALEGIHVNDGGRSFPTDYQVHRKIHFYFSTRCFRLSIQTNYSVILSKPKVTIRLKKNGPLAAFSVLSEKENLNRKSFYYRWFAFQQRIVKRLRPRGRCVDYEAKYANCTGRQNCVERCVSRKFIERYSKITVGNWDDPLAIDRDWFSSSEWNTTKLMRILYNNSGYINVSMECRQEIPEEIPCDETEFKETVEIRQPGPQTVEIDLHFDVVQSAEELPYSLRMARDLLGIQGFFFGFTFLKLIWSIYEFLQSKRRVRKTKVIWFLICLICSLGCSWTTVRMLDVIVNGELVSTEHFEIAKQVKMPAMVFCFRIDQKLIDKNHMLTGNYLKESTKEMNAGSTFKNITYLNESNEWTPFDLRRVERFFFLNMKCFRVDIDLEYDRNQFHFSDNPQVLRVDFNRSKDKELIHFMTQSRETKELSKILNLDPWNYLLSISHETSLYEYKDRFSFFRGHYPVLPEGDVTDLHKQLLKIQKNEPSRRTLRLPLEEEHFNLEVDERHFEQLYWAKRQSNLNIRSLNGQQRFVTNRLGIDWIHKLGSTSATELTFQLVFMRRIVYFTNEVNYATLTLGLLNLLSIWLELGVFDLRSLLVGFHNNFFVYVYLYLPVLLLRKIIKCWFFFDRLLMKLANRWVVITTRQPQSSVT